MTNTYCLHQKLIILAIALAVFLISGCTPKDSTTSSSTNVAPLSKEVVPTTRRQATEQAIRSGELYAAVQQLVIASETEDQSTETVLQLANLYNQLGEIENADEILTALATKPNAPPDVCLFLAQTRSKRGDFKGAAVALRPLLPRFTTQQPQIQQVLVRTFLLAGDADTVAPLLPKATTDAEWLALEGLSALVRDQPQQAARQFARAVSANPQDAWNTFLWGYALQRAGKATDAITVWSKAVQLADVSPEATVGLAQLLAKSGKGTEAAAVLSRLSKADSANPAYWQVRQEMEQAKGNRVAAGLAQGYALYYGGDPRRAETVWQKILPLATGSDAHELYAALHNSAFKRQDPQSALRWTTEALQRWPNDPYFHKRHAEVLLSINKIQEAEAEARSLVKDTSTLPEPSGQSEYQPVEVVELLCRIALDGGKPELLRESVERYQKLKPESPNPLLHLAEWQAQQGRDPKNLEATLSLYQQAAALDPKDADTQAHIGILLADLKQPQEAISVLLHALTLWPRVQDGAPHARLAQLYQREGKAAEARFHAAQYQKLRRIKERWPTLLKALRQDRPLAEWKELGEIALFNRENWIARCAYRRATQIAPRDAESWRGLAAVEKRQGYFIPALEATLKAHRLESGKK